MADPPEQGSGIYNDALHRGINGAGAGELASRGSIGSRHVSRSDRARIRRACRWWSRSPRPASTSSRSTSTSARWRRSRPATPTSRTSPSERLQAVRDSIEATTHYAPLARTDAVLICVPTPLTANREPDLGAADRRRPRRSGSVSSAASSSCWSRRPIRARRASSWCRCSSSSGLKVGDGLNVAFSPERVDPGSHRLHAAQHAQGRRRDHPGVHRARRRALRSGSATTSSASRPPRPPR